MGSRPPRPSDVLGIEHGFRIAPPTIGVDSRYIARWVFDASDESSAFDKAQHDLVPELEAVLTMLDTDRYRLEFVRLGPVMVSGPVRMKGAWTPSAVFSMPAFTRLTNTHATAISTNLDLYRSDPTVRHVLNLLRAGDRANDFRVDEPSLTIAALNQFHLAIEAVVNSVGKPDGSSSTDADRAAVIEKLRADLMNDANLVQSVRAVNRAGTELRALNASSFKARAERTVTTLGLSSDVHDDLLDFYRFRNDYVGHPGRVLDQRMAASWATRSRQIAWDVANAFVRYRGGEVASVDPERSVPTTANRNISIRLNP